jgi:hypothetical protein
MFLHDSSHGVAGDEAEAAWSEGDAQGKLAVGVAVKLDVHGNARRYGQGPFDDAQFTAGQSFVEF